MATEFQYKVPDFVKDALLEKIALAKKRSPELSPAAFLDFDGSLIDGDITEGKKKGEKTYLGLLDLAILAGALPGYSGPEGLRSFWEKYEKGFERTEDAYLWAGVVVANLTTPDDRTLKEVVIHHLRELVEKYLFAFAHDLFEFFKTHSVDAYVISASPHFFVEELGRYLPIPNANLFGIDGRMKDGELIDKVVHDAEGKEQRVIELCKTRSIYPLFALGNKWRWDGLMIKKVCEEGGVGVLVNEAPPKDYSHPSLFCFEVR
jgi:phosphoserine phosphatase